MDYSLQACNTISKVRAGAGIVRYCPKKYSFLKRGVHAYHFGKNDFELGVGGEDKNGRTRP